MGDGPLVDCNYQQSGKEGRIGAEGYGLQLHTFIHNHL